MMHISMKKHVTKPKLYLQNKQEMQLALRSVTAANLTYNQIQSIFRNRCNDDPQSRTLSL